MRKNHKMGLWRALSLLLSLTVLCLGHITATAAGGTVRFAVSDTVAAPGETVTVTVTLPENAGLVSTLVRVQYDKSVLTLTNAENGSIFDASAFTKGNDLTALPYTMMWEDSLSTANYTSTGTLATLTFMVVETAPTGTVPITLTVDAGSTYDADLNDVPFTVKNGSVTVPSATSGNGRFTVSSVEGVPGETVQMTITADNNPGIVATLLRIQYDTDVLTLTAVENGSVFDASTFTPGNDLSAVPYALLWEDSLSTTNYAANGTLATLTFTVKENAPIGETAIILTYDADSTFNTDLNNVPFDLTYGAVTILNRIPGDANDDGEVNLKDAVVIRRYLAGGWNVTINSSNADVNKSGTVTLEDVVLITRYLAGGWNVQLV